MFLAIDQPNYIPWKGYFDLIHDVDLFIFYNDVQYILWDWREFWEEVYLAHSWICFLMLGKKHLIIFGDGERRLEQALGIEINGTSFCISDNGGA